MSATRVVCLPLASPAAEPIQARRARAAAWVAEQRDADLVVLPELWPSGYFAFDAYDDCAEPLEGPTLSVLAEAAREAGATVVGGSFVERLADGGLANTTVVLGPDGGLLHAYRKVHLFGYGSREAQLLTAGREVPVTATPAGLVGTSTCYDLRFPELYRLMADQGVQIIAVSSAWPAARLAHWRLLVQARAVENLAFVVACNASGVQEGTELAGHSMVVDPWGAVLAEADGTEDALHAQIDVTALAGLRQDFPVLDSRRIAVRMEAS